MGEGKVIFTDPVAKEEQSGLGEWADEDDQEELEIKGVACHIIRSEVGCLCGYVSVERDHPWFGKHYDEIECEVHGGITFSQETEQFAWLVGFDCAHSSDIVPLIQKTGFYEKESELPKERANRSYKNISYVKRELESLVDQYLEAGKSNEKQS